MFTKFPNWLKIELNFLLAIVFLVYLRGWADFISVEETAPVGFILLFFLQISLTRRYAVIPSKVYIYTSATYVLIIVTSIIVDGALPSIGLPNLIFEFSGISVGYLYCISKKKYIPIICAFIITVFSLSYTLWGAHYWYNKIYFGTFTGQISQPSPIKFIRKARNIFQVFDFWNTRCVVCFEEFPEFEKLYLKYKNSELVDVASVNIPFPEDTNGMAQQIIDKRGFTFPVFTGDSILINKVGIKFYPTIIIVKNGNIIFKGALNDATIILEKELSMFSFK